MKLVIESGHKKRWEAEMALGIDMIILLGAAGAVALAMIILTH
jgi:hypothetical protein